MKLNTQLKIQFLLQGIQKCVLSIILIFVTSIFFIAEIHSRNSEEESDPKKIGMIEKVRVRLILIDVVAEDKDGNRVSGLSKDDFHLFVDGVDKPISTFEEHCQKGYELRRESMPILAENKESLNSMNTPPADVPVIEPRYIIFYFDGAHLSIGGRLGALQATEKFIRENMRPLDNIMIAVFANRLRIIQYFSNDKEELMESLDKVKNDVALMDDYGIGEYTRIASVRRSRTVKFGEQVEVPLTTENCAEAVGYAFENYLNTQKAMEGLRSIFAFLDPIKSRKALVYFGDKLRDHPGFLYILLSAECLNTDIELISYERSLDIEPQLRKVVNEANSSRVTFYTVDTLGLTAPGERLEEKSVLNALSTLAIDTGGKLLKGSNDLTRFIPAMEEDSNCYYTIGYTPEREADGKMHTLNITIDVPHLIVRSKTGFTDFTKEEKEEQKLLSALLLPHLFKDIKLIAELFPLKPSKNRWESMIQISLNFEEIKIQEFPLKVINFAYTLYGSGKIIKEMNQLVKFTMKEDETDKAPHWVVHQENFQLPPGDYTIVAVIKDYLTEQIGATETNISLPEIPKNILTIGSILIKGSHPTEILLKEKNVSQSIDYSNFIIRPNQQFSISEVIAIVTPICSLQKNPNKGYPQIFVKRRLLIDDDQAMEFDDISLNDPPDPSSGCYNVVDIISPGSLNQGIYTFEIELFGSDIQEKRSAPFKIY